MESKFRKENGTVGQKSGSSYSCDEEFQEDDWNSILSGDSEKGAI